VFQFLVAFAATSQRRTVELSLEGTMTQSVAGEIASPYSVHPGVLMVQKWIADLQDKTGRTLQEWIELVRSEGPVSEKDRRAWLKDRFGLGTNTAWWIAERSSGNDMGIGEEDPATYLRQAAEHVEAMFSGGKAALRPIYDALLTLGKSLGSDVRACPCKTIVPLYRRHVFAEIKPATRTRIDLGFALKDAAATDRLLSTGGRAKGDRITHRIPIIRLDEIDDEVRRWLRTAYDMDGE
jgi:hypothetical protein